MDVEMGSGFCSVEHAMKVLGKSRRSIYGYVKRGNIRKTPEGLVLSDVEMLAQTASLKVPPLNARTLALLLARIGKLERDVAVLRRANGLFGEEPLRPGPEEARGLVAAVEACTQNVDRMTVEDMTQWVVVFMRLDHTALMKISEYTQRPHVTIEFCKFALALLKQVHLKPAESEADLQVRVDLSLAFKNLRDSLIADIELGLGVTPAAVLSTLNTERDALENSLRKKLP